MVLLALCFPVLLCVFLLVMERVEELLPPARTSTAPRPDAARALPGPGEVPGSRPSSDQDQDAVAA